MNTEPSATSSQPETPFAPPAEPAAGVAPDRVVDRAVDHAVDADPPGASPPAAAADPVADTPAASPPAARQSPAEAGRLLAERFPALFGTGVAKPIKLRIQGDIQARAPGLLGRKSLSIFLQRHTTSTAYIKALIAAEHRFDLDGQPAGPIAAEHRAAAEAELERRRAIVAERRAAERGPRPPHGRPPRPRDGATPTPPMAAPGGEPAAAEPVAWPPRRDGPRPDRPRVPPRPQPAARPPGPPKHAARRQDRTPPPDARRPDARRPDVGRPDARPATPPVPGDASPDAVARRSRAQLLHAFESSPLSKANFCALKGLREAEFDAVIEQARAERATRPS